VSFKHKFYILLDEDKAFLLNDYSTGYVQRWVGNLLDVLLKRANLRFQTGTKFALRRAKRRVFQKCRIPKQDDKKLYLNHYQSGWIHDYLYFTKILFETFQCSTVKSRRSHSRVLQCDFDELWVV